MPAPPAGCQIVACMATPSTPFTVADLGSMGHSRGTFRAAVERGEFRRLLRGVYVAASAADTPQLRAAAVALVVTPDHVIVDRTAAWIHGVDCFALTEREAGTHVEVCVPGGRHATERKDVRGRERCLADADVMTMDGLRVTTPLRTALDLGCHLREREALAALNELARLHALTAADLLAELPRFRGRRGVRQLRQLAPLMDGRLESARESWIWAALSAAGLPLPEPQVWVDVDGVPTYRLDFAYLRRRVAIEYDGAEFHGPDRREQDERRRRWLRDDGWTVIVVRRGDFTEPKLARWIGRVRTALEEPVYSTRRW